MKRTNMYKIIRNRTTPIYPSFQILLGLNNIVLHDLFVRSLLDLMTKTSDNNELTL